MRYALEARQITKTFGSLKALDELDLEVEVGEIFGFLGPNGSGKSTTIRIFLDQLRPDTGSATVLGLDAHQDMLAIHQRTGYVPSGLVFPSGVTGEEYLDFLGDLRGPTDAELRRELTERFDVDLTRPATDLSTGNQQKVGLIQAFLHRPELVFLDEPTTGLDPLIQHEVHEWLQEYSTQGGTVLMSSHVLSEVDRIADRVGIIREGHMATVAPLSVLKVRARHRLDFEFETEPSGLSSEALDPLTNCPSVTSFGFDGPRVAVAYEGDVEEVLLAAMRVGRVVAVHTPESDLEDVFLDFYRADSDDGFLRHAVGESSPPSSPDHSDGWLEQTGTAQ